MNETCAMMMRRKTFADGEGDVAKGFFCVETSAFLKKEEILTKHQAQTCQRQGKKDDDKKAVSIRLHCLFSRRFLILGDKRTRGKMATTDCGKVGMTAR